MRSLLKLSLDYNCMKRVQQLQEEAYQQAQNSGIFKNLQAQLKTYVYDIIEREYNNGNSKAGFQYQHPLLPKLKKYPLTSICMDLIQQFLESFKFKHTLNVFKKEINRSNAINRAALTERFKVEIKNPQSKAVLLGLVEQMVTGEVGAIRANVITNNFVEPRQPAPRTNNFIDTPKPAIPTKPNINSSQSNSQLNQSASMSNSNSNIDSKPANLSKIDPKADSSVSSNSQPNNQSASNNPSNLASNISNDTSEVKEQEKQKKGGKQDKNKKKKQEKQKPPEGAADLMGDVLGKFGAIIKTSADKQLQRQAMFEAKRAFSEERAKKVVDPSQSGANKIRGASLGKGMSSMMSKFMTQQPQAPPKNESFIQEDMDEFQQSKDSTRKNPLFSSSQSGFDKSGFDQSVDSNVIDDYEYVERARKVTKKL